MTNASTGTRGYSVGDDVALTFTIGSSESTAPDTASVHLIVTDPTGVDSARHTTGSSAPLTKSVPSSDSTSIGWAKWSRLIPATLPGRWTYQFTSTGTVRTSMGGAFAVRGHLASTST